MFFFFFFFILSCCYPQEETTYSYNTGQENMERLQFSILEKSTQPLLLQFRCSVAAS